jgi:hypothetical protein
VHAGQLSTGRTDNRCRSTRSGMSSAAEAMLAGVGRKSISRRARFDWYLVAPLCDGPLDLMDRVRFRTWGFGTAVRPSQHDALKRMSPNRTSGRLRGAPQLPHTCTDPGFELGSTGAPLKSTAGISTCRMLGLADTGDTEASQ